MNSASISGLAIKLSTGNSVYLTRAAPCAVVVELMLISTDPATMSAVLAITASGERQDVEELDLPTATLKVAIFTDRPTEVVPGVNVAVRTSSNRLHRDVTMGGASLVIGADRQTWLIERDGVAERHLIEHGRLIGRPNNR
jgi:hypothetical protein